MAIKKITYDNKVGVIPKNIHINEVWDDDMNEIKYAINTNADQVIQNANDIQNIISGSVVPDATATVKGKLKLTGDLGGTADDPTTPTALHKTGNESWTGQKSAANSNSVGNATLLQINNNYSANPNGIAFSLTSVSNSNSVLIGIRLQSKLGGNAIQITSTADSVIKPISLLVDSTEVLSIDKNGNIISTGTASFTGNVTGATPTLANHLVTKAYADGLVVGLWNDRGNYNPNTNSNAYPSTGGSGTSGTIIKGNAWMISGLGTGVTAAIGSKTVNDGDVVRALVNNPGNTDANWAVAENNIGFTPANDENVIHKTGNEQKNGLLGVLSNLPNATFTGENKGSGDGIFGKANTGYGVNASSDTGVSLSANNANGNTSNIATFRVGGVQKSYIKNNGLLALVDGLSTQYFMADGSVSTLTNPITGTGTTNFIPKFTASGVLGNSSIQTDVAGNTTITGGAGSDVLNLTKPTGASISLSGATSATQSVKLVADNTGNPDFITYVGGSERLRIQATTGNVGIGTANPQVKLEVRGKTIISNTDLIIGSVGSLIQIDQGATSGSTYSRIEAYTNGGIASGNLILNRDGGNVLIGLTTDNGAKLQVNGSAVFSGNRPITLDSFNGSISFKFPNAPFTQGSYFISSSNAVQGGFSVFGQGGSLDYHYIGADHSNPLVKVDNAGNTIIKGTISTTGIAFTTTFDSADFVFSTVPIGSQKTTGTTNIDVGFGVADAVLESFQYTTAGYGMQRITYISGTIINRTFIRSVNAGTWTGWVEK